MQTIIDAISDLLVAQYPTFPMNITNQPEGFDRPSFFIEFIQETQTDVNYSVHSGTVSIQITYFAPIDEYYNDDTENQLSVYETVLGLFPRSLPVGDRYYYINTIVGNMKDHEVFFTINLTRYASRPAETSAPVATSIEINLQEE
jgi:hypothetical protein